MAQTKVQQTRSGRDRLDESAQNTVQQAHRVVANGAELGEIKVTPFNTLVKSYSVLGKGEKQIQSLCS